MRIIFRENYTQNRNQNTNLVNIKKTIVLCHRLLLQVKLGYLISGESSLSC